MFERPPFDDDRSFTAWLEEDAQLRPPDALLGQVLSRTAATRRRPGWLVIERWFPMDTTARFGAMPRTAIFLVTLGLLVLLATAIAAGSQPRLPRPFGPAGNGSIVYSAGGDIFLADPDGSDPHPIVTGPANDRYPSFSRDGTRVMFARGDENALTLMIAMADGTGVTELASGVRWADFTPDGSQVFAIRSLDGKMLLSLIDLDGSRSITDLPTGAIEPWGWVFARPPDGRELVFMAHPRAGTSERAMYAIALDGTPPRMIGEPAAEDSPDGASPSTARFSFQDPSISPDGSTIDFWNWEPGPSGGSSGDHMHRRDLDSGEELPVPYAPTDGTGVYQHYSPDGKWIVFEGTATSPGGEQQVYLAPVDGSSPPVPVGPAFTYTYLDWFDFSPDGTKVLLTLRAPGTSTIIDLETLETTDVPAITGGWGWQRLAP